MQSLLSRSGLAHRCYCRSCGTVVEAFGGRAAARPWRKATFAEIFTACYSSVFATAALVDAIRKDDRRQSLDRRLEEARRDLADLQERRPNDVYDDPRPHFLLLNQMDTLWTSLKDILYHRPYMKEIHRPAAISASALVESLKRDYYGCAGGADLAARRQIDYDRLERTITAEESDKRRTYRQPQKASHLRMESMGIEELVLRFLDRAKFLPESDLPSPSFDEACRVMREGYPRYTFRAIDPVGAQRDTTILNKRLRTLIAAPDARMSMRERIGRICYNLLVSAYPPDMHTYNTLIVAFNRSGHHTFAEALVSSFFHSRLLQPTPSTYVAILNHYKCTGNHGKFLRALACLTGMEPKLGGKIRRRHVEDIELSPLLQRWAADLTRRTRTGDWVWEHIPLTRPLVEEIIRGLLHFKLFDQAVAFLFACVGCGVRMSIETARLVLDECVEALDWGAAARMIRSLATLQGKWWRLLSSADVESRQLLAARIFAMIDLCGLRGTSHLARQETLDRLMIPRARFKRFLATMEEEAPLRPESLALRDGFDGARSRLLQLESIGKELDYVGKTTVSIESKLCGSDFPDGFRASMVRHIGASAIERSARLCAEVEALLSGLRISERTPGIPEPSFETVPRQGPTEDVEHTDEGELSREVVAGQTRRGADSRPGRPLLALTVMRGGQAERVETS